MKDAEGNKGKAWKSGLRDDRPIFPLILRNHPFSLRMNQKGLLNFYQRNTFPLL